MKKVILTPTQLNVKCFSNTGILYASLWNIKSSDVITHNLFCDLAKQMGVFNFYNTGEFADEDVPYTFDDGGYTITWIESLCNLIITCINHGIKIVVKLDKTATRNDGVTLNYDRFFLKILQID